MKIVTYNLNFRRKEQTPKWSKIFNDFDPDIVLAQEVRHSEVDVPANQGKFFWPPDNCEWGSAIFIKHGEIKPLDLPEKFRGWVVGAEVTNPDWLQTWKRPLKIFSIHAKKEKSSYYKFVSLALTEIAKLRSGDEDLIIGGDFNFTVGVWYPSQRKDGNEPEGLEILTRLRKEFGLINCWQAANPNRNLPQTLRWGSDKTDVYHCDGIFVPAHWYQYLDSCEVFSQGWEELSDHNPVVATFGL